jgi:hypothetical protein
MRRAVCLLLAAFMLAVPSAAFAQSAGDEQYADPFGQTGQSDGSGQSGGSQEAPAQTQTPAPAPAPAQSDETASATQTQVVQQTDAPTLPATGFPAGLLAGTGALLLAAGTTLRRRTS